MQKRIAAAYYASPLLEAPLFCLYAMLSVVLCKEMGLGSFGLFILAAAKPLVALISSLWNGAGRRQIILTSLVSGGFATFMPLFNSPVAYVLGFGLFFFSARAALPAWMELMRTDLDEQKRSHVVSRAALIGYICAALTPLLVGPLLDKFSNHFDSLFFVAGLISLSRIPLLMMWLPAQTSSSTSKSLPSQLAPHKKWWSPWRESLDLLSARADFARYQMLFFFGGLGLMIVHPALAPLVTRELGLSYTEVGLAFSCAKGAGFMLATPFASKWFSKVSIFTFSGAVTALAAAALLLQLCSLAFTPMLYLGFFVYGVMQAGSHLSWHLSGPHFSGSDNSAPYTSLNVALVGLRGLIGPAIGALTVRFFGVAPVFILGALMCLFGSLLAWRPVSYAQRSR